MANNPIPKGAGQRQFSHDAVPRAAAPSFGTGAQRVNQITIDLSRARDNEELNVTGNLLWAYQATDTAAVLNVKFNEQAGNGIDYREGLAIGGIDFDVLYLTNEAQASPDKSITLFYAVEGARNIDLINAAATLGNVKQVPPRFIDTTADTTVSAGSSAKVADVNLKRRELFIGNRGGSEVRVGDSNVGASRGVALSSGATLVLETRDEVYVYNTGSSGADISVTETEFE